MTEKTILVVDDETSNIDIVKNVLSNKYKIKAATSGERAIMVAQKAPQPDLILLDIMMPGMDGYQACKQLKLNPQTRNIPVIFVSAKVTPDEKQRGMDIGALAYVTKPIQPNDLIETVDTIISLF